MGARLARALPPAVRYGVTGAAGVAWWTLDRARHPDVLSNYGAALGLPVDDPEVARVVRRAFRNYGEMVADFMLVGALSPEEIRGRLTADGLDLVDRALAGGRGAIVALPHMGSWDMAAALGSIIGYRVTVVAEPFPGSLDEAILATRSSYGVDVVPTGRSAVRAIHRALDAGSIVALACDLPPAGTGVEVRLFGHRAQLARGPASISIRRQVPIVPVFARRSGPGRYHVHIDPVIAPPAAAAATGAAAAASLMQAVAERFETFIRGYPDQWFAFKRVVY